MENYLKGKKKMEHSCNHLESVKRSLSIDTGLPDKKTNRVEISGQPGEPTVECITRDGRVMRILITCTCGQQIELNCQYT